MLLSKPVKCDDIRQNLTKVQRVSAGMLIIPNTQGYLELTQVRSKYEVLKKGKNASAGIAASTAGPSTSALFHLSTNILTGL